MFQPNFVTFTSLEVAKTYPMGGSFKGNQNDGFQFVLFADGSGGITKQLKDWYGNKTGRLYPAELLATQEYLSALVGGAINAPIRDCHFVDEDALMVIMPFIEGKTGEELGIEDYYPDNHQGDNLRLFDYLVANADRRPKNLIYTDDGRIVGIDHALCNFRPREASPELISRLWNNGLTLEALLIIRPKLVNLWGDFAEVEFTTQHQNMIDNLDKLIKAFQILSHYAVIEKAKGVDNEQPKWQKLLDEEKKAQSEGDEEKAQQIHYQLLSALYDEQKVAKGDVQGHEFHGNQYTGGKGTITIPKSVIESHTMEVPTLYHGYNGDKPVFREGESRWGHGGVFAVKYPEDAPRGDGVLQLNAPEGQPFKLFAINDLTTGSFDILEGLGTDKDFNNLLEQAANSEGIPATTRADGSKYFPLPRGQYGIDYYRGIDERLADAMKSAGFDGWRMGGEIVVWNYDKINGNQTVAKGDVAGHPFHGNQYETGESGSAQKHPLDKLVRAWSITDHTENWRKLDNDWSQQLQDAVLNAPPSKSELFSGVSVPADELQERYGVGKTLHMTLASFSDKPSVARDFASKREGYDIYSTPRDNLRVILHLPEGTKALDANQYGGVTRFHEQIVSGDFVVASQKEMNGYTHIYLQSPEGVSKGDIKGHEFHGNQWTVSMPGDYTYRPERGSAPNATQNPDGTYTWHQDHNDLVREALAKLKGSPVGIGYGLRDEPATSPQIAKAKALYASVLYELQHNATDTPKLYRGSKSDDNFTRPFDEWSESKSIASNFAKKYGGEVQSLPAGTKGIRIADYLGEGGGYLGAEKGWLVAQSPVEKGDVSGHEFHGNQYTGGRGGTATLERPNDKFSFEKKQRILSQWSSTYRHRDFSEFLDRNRPYWYNEHELFQVELFARNTGGHVTPANFPTSGRSLTDPEAEPLQEQCDLAIANADEFMGLISDIAKPYHADMVRGIYDPDHTIASKFITGSTVDLPISSWTNSYHEEMAQNFAENVWQTNDPRNPQSALMLHAPEGTVGADLAGFTASPQVLTGGRFMVDRVEVRDNGATHVYLTQQQFYAKSRDWKKTEPNYLPNWFPQNFKANLFVAKALQQSPQTIQKGDKGGHEFHGNQYTGGIGGSSKNEPPHISFIRGQISKFYGAGGKIESVESTEAVKAVLNEVATLEDKIYDTADERLKLGLSEMKMSCVQAQDDFRPSSGAVVKPFFLVARDANGNLAACINGIKVDHGVHIGNLGSAQIVAGAATALEERVAQLANGTPVSSYALWDAVGYHELIGREVDKPFDEEDEESMKNGDTQIASYWNADTVKEIAQLPSPEPTVVKSTSSHWFDEINPFWKTPKGIELLSKTQVKKGDKSGHEFHGNQWVKLGGDSEYDHGYSPEQIKAMTKSVQDAIEQGAPRIMKEVIAPELKEAVSKDLARRMDKNILDKAVIDFGRRQLLMVYPNDAASIAKIPIDELLHTKTTDKWGINSEGILQFRPPEASVEMNGDDPRVMEHLREQATSYLVATWATTSNDSHFVALAIQQATIDEFGLKGTAEWKISDALKSDVETEYSTNGDLYRNFVRAQYESTQEFFQKAGITEVPVYRGFEWRSSAVPDWVGSDKTADVPLRPLSSFSYDRDMAVNFAYNEKPDEYKGYVISGVVPVSRILSCSRTGVGCYDEQEITVLGGTEKWNILNVSGENAVTKGDLSGHSFHGNQYTGGIGGGENPDQAAALEEAVAQTLASLPTRTRQQDDFVVGQLGAPKSGDLKAYVCKNIAERLGDKFDRGLGIRRMDEPIQNVYGTPTKPLAQCFTHDDLWSSGQYIDANGEQKEMWTYLGNTTDPLIQEYLSGANNDYADENFTRGDTQGFAEARIGEKENNDQALRENKISELIGQWAQSSNDNSYKSLAIQQVANEMLGLKDTADWKISPSTQEDIDYYRQNNDEFLKAFVQAQYDTTQQFLKDNNITSVQVYRGFSFLPESEQATPYTRVKAPDWAKSAVGNPNAEGTSVTVPLRPLSSFASSYSEAANFAGNPGVIIQGTVPASKIFSLPTTGFGCLAEKEVVVLGGTQSWQVKWASPPTKVVNKGDKKGHEFHGNQWVKGIGGEKLQTEDTWIDGTPLLAGWQRVVDTDNPNDKKITLVSDKGNKAIFSRKTDPALPKYQISSANQNWDCWRPDMEIPQTVLKTLDGAATGKTVDFTGDINKNTFGKIVTDEPNTIIFGKYATWITRSLGTAKDDEIISPPYEQSRGLDYMGEKIIKSVWSTSSFFENIQKAAEATTLHEIGHSNFYSEGHKISEIFDALKQTAEDVGYEGRSIDWEKAVSSADTRFAKAFGRGYQYIEVDNKTMTATEYGQYINSFGRGNCSLTDKQSEALQAIGATEYGSRKLQELVAENYAMWSMPQFTETPMMTNIAKALNWGERPVGK